MTWQEAIEILINRTRHERYRMLCADNRPDHEVWRARAIEFATGIPRPVDAIMAEARSEGIPERIEPRPCGGC